MAISNGTPEARPAFAAVAANALRYWEPRRLLYNLALAAVVAIHVAVAWPRSRAWVTGDMTLGLFFFAVLANVAYCAAYAADLFVQYSGLRDVWPRRRWIVLLTGTAFAAVITHFVVLTALQR